MILTRNRQEAEALVSEAYARAVEKLGHTSVFAKRKSEFFRSLREIWLEHNEGHRKADNHNLNTEEPNEFAAENDYDVSRIRSYEDSRTKHLRAAIHALPLSLQEIIVLRVHEEFSHQEIAAVVRCSVEAVAAQIIRARLYLKSHLGSNRSIPIFLR